MIRYVLRSAASGAFGVVTAAVVWSIAVARYDRRRDRNAVQMAHARAEAMQ